MWNCPSCGGSNSNDFSFCMNCGTPRKPGGAFCEKCGYKFP